jgi:hypothetical protein
MHTRAGRDVPSKRVDQGPQQCRALPRPSRRLAISPTPDGISGTRGIGSIMPVDGFVERFNGTVLNELFRVKGVATL